MAAHFESEIAEVTNVKEKEIEQMTDIDKKELPTADKVVSTEPQPKTTRLWIERLILCVALFFPLFLATLDTSMYPM